MMRGDIKLDTTAGTKTLRELLKVLPRRPSLPHTCNHIIRGCPPSPA